MSLSYGPALGWQCSLISRENPLCCNVLNEICGYFNRAGQEHLMFLPTQSQYGRVPKDAGWLCQDTVSTHTQTVTLLPALFSNKLALRLNTCFY